MPRTLAQAAAFVLGLWLALELIQPIGLVGPRGATTGAAFALPDVAAPPPPELPSSGAALSRGSILFTR